MNAKMCKCGNKLVLFFASRLGIWFVHLENVGAIVQKRKKNKENNKEENRCNGMHFLFPPLFFFPFRHEVNNVLERKFSKIALWRRHFQLPRRYNSSPQQRFLLLLLLRLRLRFLQWRRHFSSWGSTAASGSTW